MLTTTAQPASNQQSSTSNNNNNNSRLQFNRLATERKTVHVMNANINKDITKRDRQILASYNNQGGMNPHQQAANGTNLTNALNYPNQHYLNSAAGGGGGGSGMGHHQNTLDYNMTTGRSHTNAGSFLQKLSSKFSRRYLCVIYIIY